VIIVINSSSLRLQGTQQEAIQKHTKHGLQWIASSAAPPRNDDACVVMIIHAAQVLFAFLAAHFRRFLAMRPVFLCARRKLFILKILKRLLNPEFWYRF
jgi:hypothetical protein